LIALPPDDPAALWPAPNFHMYCFSMEFGTEMPCVLRHIPVSDDTRGCLNKSQQMRGFSKARRKNRGSTESYISYPGPCQLHTFSSAELNLLYLF
jgi:hypothetical protein